MDGTCQKASCSDNLQNQDETDVDCGGITGCNRCGDGKRCSAISDCDGGDCLNNQCRPAACGDSLKNNDETDVDCGGSCNPCETGKSCKVTADCDGVLCTRGKCQPPSCSDELTNGDETDVDCGGSCDSACADGLACKVAADCTSSVCPKTHKCAAPTCDDKVLNGDEPSVDCGGSCTTKCQILDACALPADCDSATCTNKRCVPAKPTGVVLNKSSWVATASHETMMSPPSFAIDGSQMTYWITGASQVRGMWFQIDMLSEQAVLSVDIDNNDAPDTATSIDISFSNDETFATAVTPVKNHTLKAIDAIAFNQAQVGRYLRISIATANDARWWRIDEIRVKQ
jgi:hypothetical protein